MLRRIDPSFEPRREGDFRAVNRDGFMVDLITPAPRDIMRVRPPKRLGNAPADMTAMEVEKLQWLVEAPRFEAMAIAENGLPVHMVVADPRFFAAHKLWLAERPDRERVKRDRDRQQALAVAALLAGPLATADHGDAALTQLPMPLRDGLRQALAAAPAPEPPVW